MKKQTTLTTLLILSIIANAAFVAKIAINKIRERNEAKKSLEFTAIERHKIPYAGSRQTIYQLFPVNSNSIVLAGDSHTEHYDTEEFLNGLPIVNRGISGDVSTGLLNRINQILAGQPKKLIIEIGFNDFQHDIPVDSTMKNIASIVNLAKTKSSRTKIYIVSVLPSSTVMGGINPQKIVPEINSKLKAFSAANSISYIDVNTQLSVNGSLNKAYDAGDGIHLNGAGYQAYTKVLKPYLSE
jgi:lysophospholipase L1-like esterase